MTPEREPLDALLDSVARGERVDWASAEAAVTSEPERSQLRALHDVARVADFHRELQRDATAGAPAAEVTRWGHLLLLERVGSGASGDVYRAWDPALQREVALKLLRPRDGAVSSPEDVLEEARTLARVRDPGVVMIHGAGEHDGRVGLWMEFLRGPTLDDEITRRGSLPPDEVARLGAQLGRALSAVHGAGALHRDVKPANIILERDGRVVLMDFGLGQRRAGGAEDASPFSGTPMFMSPQRLAGASATASDDLYALGATLWSALAGTPPFRARTLEDLREVAATGPTDSLRARRPDAPAALVAAIERAMAPAAPARFESAAALSAAFESMAEDTRSSAGARRSAAGVWIAVTLVVGTFVGLMLARGSRHETAPAPSPSSPATPPAAIAYDISANFLRRGRGGDVRLASGDRVSPGDRLSLEFHATRPVWIYVLEADERGECYLLFPQPLFDRRNPLPSDSTLILPGTRGGREAAWTVTSRGGREHFLVIAGPAPVPEMEAELSRLPAPQPGRPVSYARLSAGTVERLRGVGGVSELTPARGPQRPAAVFERLGALAGREQGVHGTWVRQITFENP
jgi:hypothetical protein